jgi:hypothetical protein
VLLNNHPYMTMFPTPTRAHAASRGTPASARPFSLSAECEITRSKMMKPLLQNRKSHALGRAFRGLLGAGVLQVLVLCLATTASQAAIDAIRIATGLTLPLYVCAPPGDKARIFVPEQGARSRSSCWQTTRCCQPHFSISAQSLGKARARAFLG